MVLIITYHPTQVQIITYGAPEMSTYLAMSLAGDHKIDVKDPLEVMLVTEWVTES